MSDYAKEIRAALVDPKQLCVSLGLTGKQRANGTVFVNCPNHMEKTPSCSVRVEKDGTIGVFCFGCGFGGDALRLIAKVHNLDERSNFKELLLVGAELAGLTDAINELTQGKPRAPRPIPKSQTTIPERPYPPNSEVERFWGECGSVQNESASNRLLVSRGMNPEEVDRYGLAKAITANQWLPKWAGFETREKQQLTWRFTGHRLIVPVYSESGSMLSVRAWQVEGNSELKRLPPFGYKAFGLVMANRHALSLCQTKRGPCKVLVAEGEPDFLTASLRWWWMPVFGIVPGSWTPELAKKIPMGSEIIIMTHHDQAGEKYMKSITETVKNRAVVLRSSF